MSHYAAIFPIDTPLPEPRLHRQALNQLPSIVPDTITITGPWTGHTWTDPHGRRWYVLAAPAEGTDTTNLAQIRALARHIHPTLAGWIDGPSPEQHRAQTTSKPRLERLQELLNTGTAIEDALTECGWRQARSASKAARRAGNLTLARTLEAAA